MRPSGAPQDCKTHYYCYSFYYYLQTCQLVYVRVVHTRLQRSFTEPHVYSMTHQNVPQHYCRRNNFAQTVQNDGVDILRASMCTLRAGISWNRRARGQP